MTEEELTKILLNIEQDPIARNQLKQTRKSIIKKLGLTGLGVKTLLEEDEKIRARKTVKNHTETQTKQETEKQEPSPLTNYFRGTWLIKLIKQYKLYARQATTENQRQSCKRAIEKIIPLVKKDWIRYCENIGRPDQEEKWQEVYQIAYDQMSPPAPKKRG